MTDDETDEIERVLREDGYRDNSAKREFLHRARHVQADMRCRESERAMQVMCSRIVHLGRKIDDIWFAYKGAAAVGVATAAILCALLVNDARQDQRTASEVERLRARVASLETTPPLTVRTPAGWTVTDARAPLPGMAGLGVQP